MDIASGYAFVTTPEHCLAWNFAKVSFTCTLPVPYACPGSVTLINSEHKHRRQYTPFLLPSPTKGRTTAHLLCTLPSIIPVRQNQA